jgi:hypothetical protein
MHDSKLAHTSITLCCYQKNAMHTNTVVVAWRHKNGGNHIVVKKHHAEHKAISKPQRSMHHGMIILAALQAYAQA